MLRQVCDCMHDVVVPQHLLQLAQQASESRNVDGVRRQGGHGGVIHQKKRASGRA